MQISRFLFLTPRRRRRASSRRSAPFQIEKNFTKEEILALYWQPDVLRPRQYGVDGQPLLLQQVDQELSLPEPR